MPGFDEFYEKLLAMQIKLNEINDKLDRNEAKKDAAHHNGVTKEEFEKVTIQDITSQKMLHYNLISEARTYVLDKITERIEDVPAYISLLFEKKENQSEEEYQSDKNQFCRSIYEGITAAVKEYGKGTLAVALTNAVVANSENIQAKKTEGYEAFFKNFFENAKESDLFPDFMKKYAKTFLFNHTDAISFENVDKIKNFFDKTKEAGINLDDLSFDDLHLSDDFALEEDTHPFHDTLQRMKEANKEDEEYIKALEEADRILVKGQLDFVHLASDTAESTGAKNDIAEYALVENNITSADKDTALLMKYESSALRMKDESQESLEKVKEVFVSKEKYSFSPEFKNDIKNFISRMEKEKIFTLENYKVEGRHKYYSFTNLMNKKDQIQDAVEKGNREEIIKNVNEYVKFEKAYDDMIKDLKDFCPNDNFSGNISSSREEDVPAKYRNDIIGASRLSGLWQVTGCLNNFHIDVDEFLDDPFGSIERRLVELGKQAPINQKLKDNDLATVWSKVAFHGVLAQHPQEAMIATINRVYDPLARMIKDDNERAKFETQIYLKHATVFNQVLKNSLTADYQSSPDVTNNMMNILAVDVEDRDASKITEGYFDVASETKVHFDRDAYIKEHKNYESILLRAYDSLNNLYDKYPDQPWTGDAYNCTKNIVTKVDELCEDKTDLVKDALKLMKDEKPFKKTMVENLKSVTEFKKISYKGIDDNSVKDAVKVYKDLKDKYAERTLWAKIFYRNVRQQNVIIKSYESVFTKHGYSKEQVTDMMKEEPLIQENKEEVINDNNLIKENIIAQEEEKKQLDISEDLKEDKDNEIEKIDEIRTDNILNEEKELGE